MNKFMEFYNHVTSDKEAAARLEALSAQLEMGTDQDAALDMMISFAAEEGFSFEKEEVKAYFARIENGELLDEELEAVAGGKDYDGGCFIIGVGGGFCMIIGVGKASTGYCLVVGALDE